MLDVELLTRHFLGIYFLLIGLSYTSICLGLWRRSELSHIQYGEKGSSTWWNRHIFNLFRAAILGVCVIRIFLPVDPWLGIISPLYKAPVLLLGVAILLSAYSVIGYVHSYMREDWRSGIDSTKLKPLLIQGPFARSRNPLFIGVILGQIGFFLALPSIFTLICLVVGVSVIIRQAHREEDSLASVYGQQYLEYQRRVPRWL